MKSKDKYRGCLIGGAAGDALGYAVEFADETSIFEEYGENGITEFELVDGLAEISDDTQMTLFTANGLVYAQATCLISGQKTPEYLKWVRYAYLEWYKTQTESFPLTEGEHLMWLTNQPELFSRRAPGRTCLTAIKDGANGKIGNPINDSKGCGGAMRAAPVGLCLDTNTKTHRLFFTTLGAEIAALTHGHELGYIPAAAFVHIIQRLAHNDDVTIEDAVNDMMETIKQLFTNAKDLGYFLDLMNKAIEFSEDEMDDLEAIRQLGEGWVAEETLAIAIYCVLKYPDDFEKALVASVNHGGDSDSTGAFTGNIMGAYLGLDKIPQKYVDNLELKDVIIELADDLFNAAWLSEGDTEVRG